MAHRLFSGVGESAGAYGRSRDPFADPGVGSLPCGAGYEYIAGGGQLLFFRSPIITGLGFRSLYTHT